MSAWWILPAVALIVAATVLWWVGRRVREEATALRGEVLGWDHARDELGGLRADARELGAQYRQLRRR